MAEPRSVDALLAEARAGLQRVGPTEAQRLTADGGLLVDIRPQHQRAREGEVPGALLIERNVLEWRLDPQADTCIEAVTGYGQPIVVMCSEGYTSSLAAAALQQLGFRRATDIDGGFLAWEAAGLPTQSGGAPPIP